MPRSRPETSDPADTGPVTEVAAAEAQPAPLPDRTTDEGDGGDDAVAVDPPARRRHARPSMLPTGWKIQIAAAPNAASAKAQLDKAKTKAGKLLASASPYTETVVKDSVTLYRARFAGFKSRDKAQAALRRPQQAEDFLPRTPIGGGRRGSSKKSSPGSFL